MKKRLALTTDGKLTYCTASEENVGKGRCNHVAHQRNNEGIEEFCNRIDSVKTNKDNGNSYSNKIKNLNLVDKVKLIESEYVSDEVLDILVNDENTYVRVAVASHGRDKDLDILVKDEDKDVRYAVAAYGRDKDLDVLVNDEKWIVRESVARFGRDKDLDVLVSDKDWRIRKRVAEHGRDKDLDILANDEKSYVRAEVAEYGRDKDLDILVNDEDKDVRYAVARHGRDKDLDILINDESYYTRDIVIKNENFKYDKRLANNKGRLEMIKEGCSEKEMDFICKGPKNKDIKLSLIEKGIDVEKFLADEDEEVQETAFKKVVKK